MIGPDALQQPLDEGLYIVVDGNPVKLPKYNLEAISRKIEDAGLVSGSSASIRSMNEPHLVLPSELDRVLTGAAPVPGWDLESIKHILREIQTFEYSELQPGDSRPVYWFDQDGRSVTIGIQKLDGSLKTGTVSLSDDFVDLLDSQK